MGIKLEIIANGMEGEGIAKNEGKVCFVDGALKGETVLANIISENKSFQRAQISQILKQSSNRVAPPCPYYNVCGGCNMQHMCYDKQVEIKQENIISLLKKANLCGVVKQCIKSPNQFNYRNKITLYYDKKVGLGFYQKKSKNICAINRCLIAFDGINKLIELLNNFLKQNADFAFVLKGMAIRQINNTYLINLILTKKINTIKLQNYLKLHKVNYALYFCINLTSKSVLPTYPCIYLGGESVVETEEFGIKYPIYPMSFLQVNNQVKELIYNQILCEIECDQKIIDAYSGAGLLSAIMAKKCKKVYAVEIDPSASKASKDIAKLNKIKNLQSICGDCAVELPNLLKEDISCVVLDPARKGVDENLLKTIAGQRVRKIIYLSCNPATLVRDLKILCDGGYNLQYIQPYDMFPNTSELESLAVLNLKKD